MKRVKIVILLVLCMLIFCSCSDGKYKERDESIDEKNKIDSNVPVSVGIEQDKETKNASVGSLAKIGKVFLEDLSFFDVGLAEKISINELRRSFTMDETVEVTVSSFSVIDLDNDGSDEVVLWLIVDGNEYFGSEILYFAEDEVYGFFVPYRGFNSLKTDGTFSFSGGAGNSGFGMFKFTPQEYVVEKITFCETHYNEKNEETVSFVVNGQEATQEKFELELEIQNNKMDVERYIYTEDNVKKHIS